MTAALSIQAVAVSYGGIAAVEDVTFDVGHHSAVAVVGANGAGKTSLLRGISGLERTPARTRVLLGEVNISADPPAHRAKRGLGHVLENRRLFHSMTVRDNLDLAASIARSRTRTGVLRALSLMPEVEGLLGRRAGTLSGGQQQFVAIARAIATEPTVLLLDEPTNGLAPRLVDRVVSVLNDLRRHGVAILIVEQRLDVARSTADIIHVLSHGRVAHTLPADDPDLERIVHGAYLS